VLNKINFLKKVFRKYRPIDKRINELYFNFSKFYILIYVVPIIR